MIKKESKVLITGCGGMLGEAVYKRFSPHCEVLATDIDLNETWLSHLDVRDENEIKKVVEGFNPDYIVHLAALTDMEYCETHFEDSYKTNADSALYLSREAAKRGIPFLYISTAGIFDGQQEFYNENDIPNPLSIYGRTKYVGELYAKSIPKSIVVRAGWMMGGGPSKDKKFINKIIKQLKAGNKEIFAITDKLGVPCYTYDLANILFYLLDTEQYGVYHGACDGSSSRYEVAEYLLKEFGLSESIKLTEVGTDYFKNDYFAPRPPSEKLVNNSLNAVNSSLTRDWKVCLEEYVNKFDWGV
jgi:dTDP-4-dehydrorhamnose reductase